MTTIQDTLWTEKYRPQTLDDIIGHENIVKRLKEYASDSAMPHLLFYGQQGVGKTAMTTALAREIYGDSWRNNMMELNASSDRGIDVIRDDITERASQGPIDTEQSFQLIFLDEADSLTPQAMQAFRRTMEDYADVTRFILSCNYPDQIIDPILSRCARFRVTPLENKDLRRLLTKVANEEDVDVEEGALDEIVRQARGDARRAIMDLQNCSFGGELTTEEVNSIIGIVDKELISEIVELAVGGEADEAMKRFDNEVLKQGIDSTSLISTFMELAMDADIPGYARHRLINEIGEVDRGLPNGANAHIQFHSLLMKFQAHHHLPPIGEEKVPRPQ